MGEWWLWLFLLIGPAYGVGYWCGYRQGKLMGWAERELGVARETLESLRRQRHGSSDRERIA